MSSPVEKLALIRAAMKQNGIDAYLIPSTDPHLGENIPDHWKIIPWLTGFTGSAATVVITGSFAGLWTDSRYFTQAQIQLADSGFKAVKTDPLIPSDFADWLVYNIKLGSQIGFDGRIVSITQSRQLKKRMEGKDITFKYDCDLIDKLWKERPPMPDSVAFDHPVKFAGRDRSLKIEEVREKMKEGMIGYHLLTSPDDIMWLLNIRGNDVAYSPLLTSYALVGRQELILFAESGKIPENIEAELLKPGVVVYPYGSAAKVLSSLPEGSSILITPATTSVTLFNAIPGKVRIVENISIPARLKAIKNKTEIENIGKVMVKDGVALTRFFFWFENSLGKEVMTEISLAEKLLELRSQQSDFLEPSFSTIIAFNEHSALPHYSPTADSDAPVRENGILLVDSGGQYMGGTTDITRTVPTGVPDKRKKIDFTLVLKGHINLANAKFPRGTKGYQLDLLGRKALWEKGMNYGHGTGHGVGYCLNVHEGPQNISPADNKTAIEPGMLLSDEPGIYRDGEYGIRTENLIICYEDEENEFGQFLKFDTISLCYIEKSLIDKSLLNAKEVNWLNNYHSEVYSRLSPHLSGPEKEWLKEKTELL